MSKYSVIIVGGGVAGLTCGITLASAKGKFDFMEDKRFLILYEDYSDLYKALLNNVPGIPKGTKGKELINYIRQQASQFDNLELIKEKVIRIEGKAGDFTVFTDQNSYKGEIIVLATGFHKFDIQGLDIQVVPHKKSPRPGKIMIPNDDYKVKDGVYVAGLLAGVITMYASASGSGAEVGCKILSQWAGKTVVVHDVPEEK
ncbi:MAG: NAD(P)/FAD-dependent oxidoreductase [Aquificae bacterium]|nr:NAD(P)/FAD-dependent oxidoreductase [Aquificota bacterium]